MALKCLETVCKVCWVPESPRSLSVDKWYIIFYFIHTFAVRHLHTLVMNMDMTFMTILDFELISFRGEKKQEFSAQVLIYCFVMYTYSKTEKEQFNSKKSFKAQYCYAIHVQAFKFLTLTVCMYVSLFQYYYFFKNPYLEVV